jgi:hypothetical protein
MYLIQLSNLFLSLRMEIPSMALALALAMRKKKLQGAHGCEEACMEISHTMKFSQ